MFDYRVGVLLALVLGSGCVEVDDSPKADPTSSAVESQPQPEKVNDEKLPVGTQPEPSLETDELECVSALTTHDGSYYSVKVAPVDGRTSVIIQANHLAKPSNTGFGDDVGMAATSEQVYSAVTDSRFADGFFGFEDAAMFLVVEGDEQPGLFTGTMGGESELHDGSIPITCWSNVLKLPARYVESSGKCGGPDGEPARNNIPFIYSVHKGFGQCATFEGQLNGDAFGYPSFVGLDLKGADLSGAALNFAHLIDADLRGAKLGTFSFGYATVRGQVDEHTIFPNGDWCDVPVDGEPFDCSQ